jgi:hypothetical protein
MGSFVEVIMNTVHQLAVGNANSHMQSVLASINWELAQQIVFELEVRLADALARNQENRAKLHRHMLQVSFSARALANRQQKRQHQEIQTDISCPD